MSNADSTSFRRGRRYRDSEPLGPGKIPDRSVSDDDGIAAVEISISTVAGRAYATVSVPPAAG
jgi:hypothetical protein